ncbi:MAG TPA: DUF1775 domain-containing protein [Gaiellaceae bacterium]|jgi:uncharacterized protein YcnI|nr:DUF1775 domain-containing protein [Gaiellaceae bacterium]
MKKSFVVSALTALAALVTAGAASAHAHVSPPVVLSKVSQVYTLAVPTEKSSDTTQVELTVPAGFGIDSFVPAPGWKRTVQQTGSGDSAVIQKVTWSGGKVPTGEDSAFSFLASPSSSKTYTFGVRQTYADGSVVDWSGPESSDTPAPTVEAKSSLGGGGSSTLALIALVVGAVGAALGILGLVAGGRRVLA